MTVRLFKLSVAGPALMVASICIAGSSVSVLSQALDTDNAQTIDTQNTGNATDTPDNAPDLPSMAFIEQAYAAGDFVAVRDGLERHAKETGTPLAQYRYGQALLEGIGGPRDGKGAQEWLQRAVDQNHLQASTMLARMFLTGERVGIEYDPVQAAALLARSASRGDAEAQYYLGLLYRSGTGVAQDLEIAFNWILASAEQQYVLAEYELSRAYSRGEGTPLDTAKALYWLETAAGNGHVEAQFFLANAYDTGEGAPQNTSQALRWYRRAADSGYVIAQRILGTRYLMGDGVAQNGDEALRWLVPAAEAGDPGAMSNLGFAFMTGAAVPQDPAQAAKWYHMAVEHGDLPRAKTALAQLYLAGLGVEQDVPRAVDLLRAATDGGDPDAPLLLGRMAAKGELNDLVAPQRAVPWAMAAALEGDQAAWEWLHLRADEGMRHAQAQLGQHFLSSGGLETAVPFLTAAAEAGDVPSQSALGQMFATGDGVELDYVLAYTWLNIAAAQGSRQAMGQRDVIVQLMTPEQIADGQTATREFFANASGPQDTQ